MCGEGGTAGVTESGTGEANVPLDPTAEAATAALAGVSVVAQAGALTYSDPINNDAIERSEEKRCILRPSKNWNAHYM
jgi:hypothetical protein